MNDLNIKKAIAGGAVIWTIIVGGITYTVFPPAVDCKDTNCIVQVKVEQQTEYGKYNDAIYYTPDEWENKSTDEIKAEEQARVDNWINIIQNPAPVIEPTLEELQNAKVEMQNSCIQQIEQVNEQIKEAKTK